MSDNVPLSGVNREGPQKEDEMVRYGSASDRLVKMMLDDGLDVKGASDAVFFPMAAGYLMGKLVAAEAQIDMLLKALNSPVKRETHEKGDP